MESCLYFNFFFYLVVGLTGVLLFRSCIPKAFIKVF